MVEYDKMDLTKEQYSNGKKVQLANGTDHSEQKFGSRKTLYIDGKLIASTLVKSKMNIGEITSRQFRSFLAAFNRQLYKRLRNDLKTFDLKIEAAGPVMHKNLKLWNSLPIGSHFYNIDLDSAYWQMAPRLGYIGTAMYRKYLEDDRYKQAKRLCFSFLGRENKMTYFQPSEQTSFEIKCDMTVLKNVYDNIRHELNKIIVEASKDAGQYLEYNTDGITVLSTQVDVVRAYFYSENLEFKITKCKKISENQYLSGSKVRNFKIR